MESLTNMASSPDDEAGERLVVSEEKNGATGPKEKSVEVKYVTPDSQNGDAKIDIENLKTAFAGMGKEELMKFANDPFWVKMRWFLFILFWLIWAAMLAGAVAIIVLAPKCAAPTPKQWWELSPLYKIDVRNFKDGNQDGYGDLKGVKSKLDYLKDLGVKTIVLSNVLKSVDEKGDEAVVDFKALDDRVGTLDDLKQLATEMKEKGLYLLMSFIPNYSSDQHPWFQKSVAKEEPYTDYYVWHLQKGYDPANGQIPLPPNNWLSKNEGSAWKWNNHRKEFYLHQFGESQPEFNFHNQKVIDYFKDVMKFWLDNGVSGFHLDKVQYLLEDKDLADEPRGQTPGAVHDQYNFLSHIYTSDQEGLADLLAQWNQVSANNSGILSLNGVRSVGGSGGSALSKKEGDIGQLLVRPQVLSPGYTATDLNTLINNTLNTFSWPTWEFSYQGSKGEESVEESEQMLKSLQVVSLMLPGTVVTNSGDELGLANITLMPWDNSTNAGDKVWRRPLSEDYTGKSVESQQSDPFSFLKVYKKLVHTRYSPAFMHGSTRLSVLHDNILVYTRIKAGNPGYLVAFNTGSSNSTTVDLTQLDGVPDDLSLIASTTTTRLSNNKVDGKGVPIDPYEAIVLQFVPKAKE